MKKVRKLLCFALLCFISIISFTYAQEEGFKLDWKTEKTTGAEEEIIYKSNIAYKGGFITSSLEITDTHPKAILTRYNSKGEKIKSVESTTNAVIYLQNHNDQIYAIAATENQKIELQKLDENFAIVSKKVIATDEEVMEPIIMMKLIGIEEIAFDEQENMYLFLGDNITKIDSNMTKTEEIEGTEENIKKYFPVMGSLITSENSKEIYVGTDTKKNKTIYTGMKNNGCSTTPGPIDGLDTFSRCAADIKAVVKLEENGQEAWEKEYQNYDIIFNPKIISNYIVAVGIKQNTQETGANPLYFEVIVLDKNGTIIQTINGADAYGVLSAGNTNFMVNNVAESTSTTCSVRDFDVTTDLATKCIDVWQSVYYLPLNIVTKVDGNGKVEVINTARDGESISFKVTPEDGYVLGVIKVTDAEGNVLKFTSNTFTMPSADVTIEATFIPENPNTSDLKVIALSLILIVGSIIGFINFKRIKWLD